MAILVFRYSSSFEILINSGNSRLVIVVVVVDLAAEAGHSLHCITPAKFARDTPPPTVALLVAVVAPPISPSPSRTPPSAPPSPPPPPPNRPGDVLLMLVVLVVVVVLLCLARFVSSSFIFCSIRNWASVRLFGCPDILTIRFLVPGAKIPLLEICMFAPDRCWISVRLRPPGPIIILT